MSFVKGLRRWLQRFSGLFRKRPRDAEFAAELESNLQLHIEDNLRAGMTPEAARRDALMKLGGVEQTKENYRDRRGLPRVEALFQNLRFGSRMLLKSPGSTGAVVIALALGIGASTAMFTAVRSVLLRPLPFKNPERLIRLFESEDKLVSNGYGTTRVLVADGSAVYHDCDRAASTSKRSDRTSC